MKQRNIILLLIILILLLCVSYKNRESFNGENINLKNEFKLNVIIPIRNRDEDLNNITDRLEEIFNSQGIHAKYYIIEQSEKNKFNKGKICNAAFIESLKDGFSDNYLFNDVDVYPQKTKKNNIIDFKYHQNKKNKNKIRHPYGFSHCLGCLFMVKADTYKKINGFSNKYYGWGGEDHDIQKRAEVLDVDIDRNKFIKRGNKNKIYDDWSKEKISNGNNKTNQDLKFKLRDSYTRDKNTIKKDGVNNCQYKIVNTSLYKNKMKRIKVDV
jgi:hypothetical protein